jgi:hypothetical protein
MRQQRQRKPTPNASANGGVARRTAHRLRRVQKLHCLLSTSFQIETVVASLSRDPNINRSPLPVTWYVCARCPCCNATSDVSFNGKQVGFLPAATSSQTSASITDTVTDDTFTVQDVPGTALGKVLTGPRAGQTFNTVALHSNAGGIADLDPDAARARIDTCRLRAWERSPRPQV